MHNRTGVALAQRAAKRAALALLVSLSTPCLLRAQQSAPWTAFPSGNSAERQGVGLAWRTRQEMRGGMWRNDLRLTNLGVVPKFVWANVTFTCADGSMHSPQMHGGYTLNPIASDFFYISECGAQAPTNVSVTLTCVVETPPGVDGYVTCVNRMNGTEAREAEQQRQAALAQEQAQAQQRAQERAQAAQEAADIQRQQQDAAQRADSARREEKRRQVAATTDAAVQQIQQRQAVTTQAVQTIGDLLIAGLQRSAADRQARRESAIASMHERNTRSRAQTTAEGANLVFLAGQHDTSQVLAALQRGVDVNAVDGSHIGNTPLISAIWNDDVGMVELLLTHGANPNAEDDPGLNAIDATGHGHNIQILLLLLTHGGDPLHVIFTEPNGWNRERRANVYQQVDAEYLLRHLRMPDPKITSALQQMVPPAPAVRSLNLAASTGDAAGVRRYLAQGVPVDGRDQFSYSPLQNAAESHDTAMVALLLQAGASVNAQNAFGFTALISAILGVRRGDPEFFPVAELLLARGADPNLRDVEGNTALDIARGISSQRRDQLGDRRRFDALVQALRAHH